MTDLCDGNGKPVKALPPAPTPPLEVIKAWLFVKAPVAIRFIKVLPAQFTKFPEFGEKKTMFEQLIRYIFNLVSKVNWIRVFKITRIWTWIRSENSSHFTGSIWWTYLRWFFFSSPGTTRSLTYYFRPFVLIFREYLFIAKLKEQAAVQPQDPFLCNIAERKA